MERETCFSRFCHQLRKYEPGIRLLAAMVFITYSVMLYPFHKFNYMRILSTLFDRKIGTGPEYNPHFFDAAIIRIIAASGPDFGFVNAIPK